MQNIWRNFGRKGPDKVVAGTDREGVVAKAAEATVAKAAEATVAEVKAAEDKVVVAQAAVVVVVKVAIETRSREIVILDQSAGVIATPGNEVEDQELAVEDDLVVGLMRQ